MSGAFSLVLETSTPLGSLAAINADGMLEQREFTSDRSHNAVLFSPLTDLLKSRKSLEIQLVLVGSGPGSYSGTRVGIAAAQGVAIAAGCPAIAVPSILAVHSAKNGAACLAIGDARRGSFWTARMEKSGLLTDPQLTDAEGLVTALRDAIDDGVPIVSFEETTRYPLPAELRQHVKLEFPSAERMWEVWKSAAPENRERWERQSPQPMYLKPPHITPAKRPWLTQTQA